MNQVFINELYSRRDQINEFIHQNQPGMIRDAATGKETIVRPATSGKEYTPELQLQIAKAEQASDAIVKQIEVAESALELQKHRNAVLTLRKNPTLFNNAQTRNGIDFDGIGTTINELQARRDYLTNLGNEIEIQEEKYAEPIKAQKHFEVVAHANDETINYLNGLDPNIVKQIYAKKQEFVQAVKASYKIEQALAVRPKGLISRIKFALTKGKRAKESKEAFARIDELRSEIEEIAKQLPMAHTMRC